MNVVSTSLFGDPNSRTDYQRYLPAALRAHHNLFRGWQYRIYHDNTLDSGSYAAALHRLEEAGLVELRLVVDNKLKIEQAMLWRLFPLFDDTVEYFVLRDIDSVTSWRERRAVETWVRSGLAAHSMSDVRGHHNWPAMGGMMGFHVPQTRELVDVGPGRHAPTLAELFYRTGWSEKVWSTSYRSKGYSVYDEFRMCKQSTNNQFFMRKYLWELVQVRTMEHRLSGSCTFEGTGVSLTEVDPFDGDDLGVLPKIREDCDRLIPFIGCSAENSNLRLDDVLRFYQANGDPAIEAIFRECEG